MTGRLIVMVCTLVLIQLPGGNLHGGRAYAASTIEEAEAAAEKMYNSGKWQELLKLADEMLRLKPDYMWSHYYKGAALTYGGNPAEGERYLKKAASLDKDDIWPHYELFFNYKIQKKNALNQAAKVERMFTSKTIQSSPEAVKCFYYELAAIHQDAGNAREARNVLKRSQKIFPSDPVIKANLAWTYFRTDMRAWEALNREALAMVPARELRAQGKYQLPLRGRRIKVHQGNNETISHLGLLNGFHWDFVFVDESGNYGSNESKKEGHYIFGATVYAAADGVVSLAEDSNPDTDPMKNDPARDVNQVIINHDNGETTIYVHLMRGSVIVRPGEVVTRGQPIAKVGASGRFVDIPHLHFGVMRNSYSLEAKLTGYKLWDKVKWVDRGAVVPKKNDIMRTHGME